MSDTRNCEPLVCDRLVKSPVVARFLGVSTTTVWRMVRDNEIPFIQLRSGRKTIRFSMDEIREWVKGRMRK